MLDGVLRRQHEERLAEEERLAADRHLLFLHRLEERRLDLGGRAVDLVGEHEIREQRPLLRIELLRPLIEHHRADDVGREEIGRELNAREADAEALRHRADGERLRQSRHALEQDVAAGEQPDQQPLDHDLLADDPLGHLARDGLRQHRVVRLGRSRSHRSDASAARFTVGSLSRA